MTLRTVVFDLGNVLARFSHQKAAEQLARHARWPAERILAYLFGTPLEDDYEAGRLTDREFFHQVRDAIGYRADEEQFERDYADIFSPMAENCALVPLLKPNYRLLLLSNTTEPHARRFRPLLEPTLAHFDHLVLSFAVRARKPHPQVF